MHTGHPISGLPRRAVRPTLVALSLACAATFGTVVQGTAAQGASAVGTIGGTATAGVYAWGATTMGDGSVLIGDYWNYRIVHYLANGSSASPFVFTGNVGFGVGQNQAPFGLGVDPTTGPNGGDVWMTEGSEPNVNVYDKTGKFITSYGLTNAVHSVPFKYPSHVAVDPVSGLVYISDQLNKDLVVINQTTQTVARTILSGQVIQPRGLAFDTSDNLWVGDQGHHRIDIYKVSGSTPVLVKTIAPPGGITSTFDMRGLTIDKASKLAFVTNGQGCLIQEFNADPSSSSFGKFILQWGGCGTGTGQFGDGARELTVDGTSQVWVADLADFRTEVFSESGTFIRAVPNPPQPPPTGGFNGPRGVAFDSAGDMFVSDTFNERIEKFTLSGGVYGFSLAWGTRGVTPATFNYPRLLCFDPVDGDLIVANTDSNEIVAWSTTGHEQWAATGLADPYGVTCASNGTIYVANSNGQNVVVVNSSGVQTGTIGNGLGFVRGIWADADGSIWVDVGATGKVTHFSAAGTLLSQFSAGGSTSTPFGIAGDAGFLYIALSSSNTVGQYTRGGTLVATFGGYGTGLGSLRTPQGLMFGPNGHLYVVEENNNRVSEWSVP